ncbi:TonB-dependent receptor [Acidocella sp. MX-AZ02]|uniref:TonB-dependent receptor n=1 Tax=Acidocella sp. MX-AZ02 TaxID=1214225 RepID=UPI00028D8E5A|nr:TonB-dependent receptor [Acidocella sp. MX-AZ02]EKM98946.1 TonB-dependent receptor [Acidocella sp. MX-AZ02]
MAAGFMILAGRTRRLLLASAALVPGLAMAQTSDSSTDTTPPVINVHIGVSPLGGGVPLQKWPTAVQSFSAQDLTKQGAADFTGALARQAAGVNLQNSQANPYQPSVLYHGYELSPIQGTPAGLSVYVNGARFNTPFGDLALWSVLPDDAIDSFDLVDGNPVFGLNALGGAIDVKMKNGFTAPGGVLELQGGSFGTVEGHLEYGKQVGNAAAYVDISAARNTGWRDAQGSDIKSAYADLGWRGSAAALHINLIAGNSGLHGPGTVPVEVLAADPNAQFTGPNSINDKYLRLSSTLDLQLSRDTSLQAVLYYENIWEHLLNGNGPSDLPCGDGQNLCQGGAGGSYSTAAGGGIIPQYLPNGNNAYGQLNLNTTNTNGYGASAQITHKGALGQLVAGLSYDGGYSTYGAAAYDGALSPSTRDYYALPGTGLGYPVDEPGNVPVNVGLRNAYYGLYATDTIDLTKKLSLTLGGRFNIAQIALHNERGYDPNAAPGGLNGSHYYQHFNPSVGMAYALTRAVTLYGSWSVQNAAPTPAELSCASPLDSCALANFMSGDPALKQIVSQNFQAGLRGTFVVGGLNFLSIQADVYDDETRDDIEFLQSPYNPQGNGYFSNIGSVHRRGGDLAAQFDSAKWHLYASYSRVQATYGASFIERSNSPNADASGNITVNSGDFLPGVPKNLIKFGADYKITPRWSVGFSGTAQTGSYLYGDAANLDKPLPGYALIDLNTRYSVTPHLTLFGSIDNVTDQRYYVYGTYSSVGGVYVAQAPNYSNPRSYSIGAPVAVTAGMKLTF